MHNLYEARRGTANTTKFKQSFFDNSLFGTSATSAKNKTTIATSSII